MRVAAHSARRPRLGDLVQPLTAPVPILGIDAVHPLSEVDPLHSVFAINVVSADGGLGPRPGTEEHVTNVGAVPGDVRSLLPYHSTSSLDRLFATAQDGVYDATTNGAAPPLKLTFPTQNSNSGYGESLGFVNAAGDRFLLYTDEANGYYLYTGSADAWAAGSVSGVSPAVLSSVVQWGARVWFTERGTSRAWYLSPGAISGQATVFDFGPFFSAGGSLVGLWRWTRDGGAGMNDHLVAVSTAGDVVVFQGTDPLYPNFMLVGSWNVGGVPAGRRLASPYGGDLLVLTLGGLLSVARLVAGQPATPDTYQTESVRTLFTDAMSRMSTRPGWHVSSHPRGAFLMVNTPGVAGEPQEQFAMSLATRAWSRLRDLDVLSSAAWQGEFYLGTRDGRVLKSTGTVDNVKLGGNTSQAKAIECSVLGGFQNDGRRKFVRYFRPVFKTHGVQPAVEALVRFDYDVRVPSGGALSVTVGGVDTWNTAVWGSAHWSGLHGTARRRVGVTGVGSAVAFGVHFYAQDYAVLTEFEAAVESGGLLP